MGKLGCWAVAVAVCIGCASSHGGDTPPEKTNTGGPDAGTPTGPGNGNGGGNGGGQPDAGNPPDAGPADAGPTAVFGTPGPWPIANVTYDGSNGIQESPVVGVSTDEPVMKNGSVSQNLWVATHSALYLLRPGETKFHRYDASAGLHLPGNDEPSCDDVMGSPIRPCIVPSSADSPGISEIVGGGPNEVFVGYYGHHDWNSPDDGTANDPYRHSGQLDRVRLHDDGTIDVVRFTMVSGNSTFFWHNRTVERMIYDHFIHKHELYVGTDHGVNKFSADLWAPLPAKHTYTDWVTSNQVWMSDHLHAQTCYHHPCDSSEADLRLGDWRGLALASNGDLWHAGRWAAGLIIYTPDNSVWFNRGGKSFAQAFGDPYFGGCSGSRPVFCVPQEGDFVNLSAVAVTKDPKTGEDKVWFSSGIIYGDPTDVNYGVAAFLAHPGPGDQVWTYFDPMRDIGMAEENVRDMVAWPDGRLILAGPNTGVVIWDPNTRISHPISGLPSNEIHRLEVDTMVNPPALHVATAGGAVVLRNLP